MSTEQDYSTKITAAKGLVQLSLPMNQYIKMTPEQGTPDRWTPVPEGGRSRRTAQTGHHRPDTRRGDSSMSDYSELLISLAGGDGDDEQEVTEVIEP